MENTLDSDDTYRSSSSNFFTVNRKNRLFDCSFLMLDNSHHEEEFLILDRKHEVFNF